MSATHRVVLHRHSYKGICAESLDAVSKMTIQRPDLFLTGAKYCVMMVDEKAAAVRTASLAGLNDKFKVCGRMHRGEQYLR